MKNGFALLLPLGFGSCSSLAGQWILCRRWIADEHQFQHIQKLHEVKKQNKNYVSLTQHPIGVRIEGGGGEDFNWFLEARELKSSVPRGGEKSNLRPVEKISLGNTNSSLLAFCLFVFVFGWFFCFCFVLLFFYRVKEQVLCLRK